MADDPRADARDPRADAADRRPWARTTAPSDPDGAPVEPDGDPEVPALETWLPLLDHRSPNAWVCPFLRADGEDGLVEPVEAPDPANRCAALREAVPQSLRQQELVCLTGSHVDCPRYLRGAVVVSGTTTPAVRTGSALSPAIVASMVVLVAAFTLSVAFVLARGGLELTAVGPSASPSPDSVAAASPSVAPSRSLPPRPTPTTAVSPVPTEPPTPTPTVAPTPTVVPSPPPTEAPTRAPTPRPTSDRYQLLEPCPGRDDCWIYTVRRGDNLFSIANYFGVPLETVRRLNPWTRERGLRAGQELILPPPTR